MMKLQFDLQDCTNTIYNYFRFSCASDHFVARIDFLPFRQQIITSPNIVFQTLAYSNINVSESKLNVSSIHDHRAGEKTVIVHWDDYVYQ